MQKDTAVASHSWRQGGNVYLQMYFYTSTKEKIGQRLGETTSRPTFAFVSMVAQTGETRAKEFDSVSIVAVKVWNCGWAVWNGWEQMPSEITVVW